MHERTVQSCPENKKAAQKQHETHKKSNKTMLSELAANSAIEALTCEMSMSSKHKRGTAPPLKNKKLKTKKTISSSVQQHRGLLGIQM